MDPIIIATIAAAAVIMIAFGIAGTREPDPLKRACRSSAR